MATPEQGRFSEFRRAEAAEARVRELEGLLDNERHYTIEHRGYAQVVGKENAKLLDRIKRLRDALQRVAIAPNDLAAWKIAYDALEADDD